MQIGTLTGERAAAAEREAALLQALSDRQQLVSSLQASASAPAKARAVRSTAACQSAACQTAACQTTARQTAAPTAGNRSADSGVQCNRTTGMRPCGAQCALGAATAADNAAPTQRSIGLADAPAGAASHAEGAVAQAHAADRLLQEKADLLYQLALARAAASQQAPSNTAACQTDPLRSAPRADQCVQCCAPVAVAAAQTDGDVAPQSDSMAAGEQRSGAARVHAPAAVHAAAQTDAPGSELHGVAAGAHADAAACGAYQRALRHASAHAAFLLGRVAELLADRKAVAAVGRTRPAELRALAHLNDRLAAENAQLAAEAAAMKAACCAAAAPPCGTGCAADPASGGVSSGAGVPALAARLRSDLQSIAARATPASGARAAGSAEAPFGAELPGSASGSDASAAEREIAALLSAHVGMRSSADWAALQPAEWARHLPEEGSAYGCEELAAADAGGTLCCDADTGAADVPHAAADGQLRSALAAAHGQLHHLRLTGTHRGSRNTLRPASAATRSPVYALARQLARAAHHTLCHSTSLCDSRASAHAVAEQRSAAARVAAECAALRAEAAHAAQLLAGALRGRDAARRRLAAAPARRAASADGEARPPRVPSRRPSRENSPHIAPHARAASASPHCVKGDGAERACARLRVALGAAQRDAERRGEAKSAAELDAMSARADLAAAQQARRALQASLDAARAELRGARAQLAAAGIAVDPAAAARDGHVLVRGSTFSDRALVHTLSIWGFAFLRVDERSHAKAAPRRVLQARECQRESKRLAADVARLSEELAASQKDAAAARQQAVRGGFVAERRQAALRTDTEARVAELGTQVRQWAQTPCAAALLCVVRFASHVGVC